ncbi:MAG: hypothetical protein R3E77_03265 [Steroidobacteraceae bacterium]
MILIARPIAGCVVLKTKPLFSTRSAKSAFSDEPVARMDRDGVGDFRWR